MQTSRIVRKAQVLWVAPRARLTELSTIDIVAALGEFVGTTMFLFFAFTGTAVATIAPGDGSTGFDISVQTYIALCFGFSLMVNVWVFYRVSGGLFNPAVSIHVDISSHCPRVEVSVSIDIH